MDAWILFLSIFLAVTLSILLLTNYHNKQNQNQNQKLQQQQQQQQQQVDGKQPPGPPGFLVLADLVRHRRSIFDAEHLLRGLHAQHGPVVALRLPFLRLSVFVADRRLAHRALVEGGAAFADRAPLSEPNVFFTCGQRDISSSVYGPYWRLVRRNLASEILPPSRVELFAPARRWALAVLIEKVKAHARANDGVVVVMESFKHAIFCLVVFMCFGVELDDDAAIADIQAVQQFVLAAFTAFPLFAFFPTITKLLFRKKWNACVALKRRREEIFGALIRARQQQKLMKQQSDKIGVVAYVDSLLELRLPEEQGRKLTDGEVVTLCAEFLSGGTDTTATALQWIMANLVRRPDVQMKLYEEMTTVVGTTERKEIDEKVLSSLPYLKAVILEGLRRHPPTHFLLPHTVTTNTMLGEYCIPKGANVNFMVAEIGWEGKVWEDPMEFRPERFLEGGEGEAVDITGSREIKMMPFGAGRRMCPGYGLAMLHLEYFVSNLVWKFEWKAVEGEEIDMSEKLDFTVVMKTPLRARILSRGKN